MGPKNLLILFFSTVAVSLVILIIFFSLFFKNVNLDFNTRLPESAPDIGGRFSQTSTMSPDSKADGLTRSTVNVPPDFKEPEPSARHNEKAPEEEIPTDIELPPISDDALLENDYPQPIPGSLPERSPGKAPATEKLPSERPAARSIPTMPATRATRPAQEPVAMPEPIDNQPVSEPEPSSGPPVPQ